MLNKGSVVIISQLIYSSPFSLAIDRTNPFLRMACKGARRRPLRRQSPGHQVRWKSDPAINVFVTYLWSSTNNLQRGHTKNSARHGICTAGRRGSEEQNFLGGVPTRTSPSPRDASSRRPTRFTPPSGTQVHSRASWIEAHVAAACRGRGLRRRRRR